jgi:acetoacetyl-CoA synthetase
LVCASPFPSKPLGFLADPGGERFHNAYFAQNPGLWTHGDLVEFTSEGSAVMHGRSDGTMNIRGIRIGPAEIYRVLESFPQITEALCAVAQKNLREMRRIPVTGIHLYAKKRLGHFSRQSFC